MTTNVEKTRVLQASNISLVANREQIYQLFSFLGRVEEIKTYPVETNPLYSSYKQKVSYVRFEGEKSVEVGQHLTNTVFIDKAIICVPFNGPIPDEETALKSGGIALPGQRQLPPNVVNQIQIVGDQHVVLTIDPTMSSLGLPPYPALPANTDASKVEEIRRTIYMGNIPKDIPSEDIMTFLNDNLGEVMYFRFAGSNSLPSSYAFVEFSDQHTVPTALMNNGIDFKGKPLRIQHSRVAIVKPQHKTADMAKEEVEEAMRKRQANPLDRTVPGSTTTRLLNQGLQSEGVWTTSARTRSPSPVRRRRTPEKRRSRSPRRLRSRSHDRHDSRRSRSRDRPRRDRSRDRRQRSKSREKKDKTKDKKDKKSSSSRSSSRRGDRDKDKDNDKDRSKEKDRRRSDRDDRRRRDKDKDKERDSKNKKDKSWAEEEELALRERLVEKVIKKEEDDDGDGNTVEDRKRKLVDTPEIGSDEKKLKIEPKEEDDQLSHSGCSDKTDN